MKLVTFNINGIRARMPRLLEYLERERPDVACLQELKCADDALPIGEIEGAGYNAVWHGQKGFNGLFNPLVAGSTDDFEFNGRLMIWSKGQDRRALDDQKADRGENKNNLLNWR